MRYVSPSPSVTTTWERASAPSSTTVFTATQQNNIYSKNFKQTSSSKFSSYPPYSLSIIMSIVTTRKTDRAAHISALQNMDTSARERYFTYVP
jgi:hypothetical protein